MPTPEILFHEEQRFTQRWLMALLWIVAAAALLPLVFLFLNGATPATARDWLGSLLGPVLGIGVVLLLRGMRLVTEVRTTGLFVRFIPMHVREHEIPLENVATVESVVYRPIRDFGGWGIRYGKSGKAYNVCGNRGVQLTWKNGRTLLLGSQEPDALCEAVTRVWARVRNTD